MAKRYLLLIAVLALTSCSDKSSGGVVSTVVSVAKYIVTPPTTELPVNQLSSAAENLVTDAEVSSTKTNHSYYDKHYTRATFAGAGSGATVAVGTDLGMNTAEFTSTCWSHYFDQDTVIRLSDCTGDTSVSAAKKDVSDLQDILFLWAIAIDEFDNYEVPVYYQLTLRTFPGLDKLSNNAISACVSIVYNRGSSMVGASRIDMRNLRDAVAEGNYQAMATAVEHMKITMASSWKAEGTYAGLCARRDVEAKLITTPDS